MTDIIGVTPTDTVQFSGNIQAGAASTKITITNNHSGKIFYKLKTTKPDRYCVLPPQGSLGSKDTVVLEVKIKDNSIKYDDLNSDKFLLQTLLNEDANGNDDATIAFQKADKKNIMKRKFQVNPEELKENDLQINKPKSSSNSVTQTIDVKNIETSTSEPKITTNYKPNTINPEVNEPFSEYKFKSVLLSPNVNETSHQSNESDGINGGGILINAGPSRSPPPPAPPNASLSPQTVPPITASSNDQYEEDMKGAFIVRPSGVLRSRFNYSTTANAGSVYNPSTLIAGPGSIYSANIPNFDYNEPSNTSNPPTTSNQQYTEPLAITQQGGYIYPISRNTSDFTTCHNVICGLLFFLGLLLGYIMRNRIDMLVGGSVYSHSQAKCNCRE